MPESIVEQIQAAMKTSLEAITGDDGTTYWYTPSKVTRVDEWRNTYLKSTYTTIYLVRDTGDQRFVPGDEFGSTFRDLDVFILTAQQDTRADKDPHSATTLAGTLRNRMVHDVEKKLTSDRSLGGVAMDVTVTDVDRDWRELPGWIVAEVGLTVRYDHALGAA